MLTWTHSWPSDMRTFKCMPQTCNVCFQAILTVKWTQENMNIQKHEPYFFTLTILKREQKLKALQRELKFSRNFFLYFI